ncbi:MAG: UPF0182 family protein [Sciscionella sp.]|nr:UPF0182 family protein [Sciscionella sp.]
MANRPAIGLPRLSRRSRILVIIGVLIVVLLIAGSRLLDSYVDWLWYGEVGFREVMSTEILTSTVLFFAIGVLVGGLLALCLVIAYRTRPVFVPVTGVDDPLARYRATIVRRLKLFGIGIPVVIGVLCGWSATGNWQQVQLFLHGGDFGVTDPQFGIDIGFYAFRLPVILWLKNWLFVAIAIAFFGALIAHYIFGGIRLAGRGGQLSGPARMHLAIIVGSFVLLKAAAYFLDRYELLYSNRNDKFDGASFTDINAALPAKLILLCIAVFCAVAFFAGAFLRNLQLPAIAIVLMLVSSIVVGTLWPVLMEQFSVKANANQKEAPYIQRNMDATKQAYGLTGDKVKQVSYDPSSVSPSAATVKQNSGTLDNVRLLDPNVLSPTFTQLAPRGKNFYGFPSKLNIDRYTVGGKTQDYIVAAREINPEGLSQNQQDWINKHLVYTHGDGFVAAPANEVGGSGKSQSGLGGGYPNIEVSDLAAPGVGGLHVTQPRIYFGELDGNADDYAVVGANGNKPQEYDTDKSNFTYNGSGGVSLSNWFNKLVFAGYFGDRNFLLSNAIGPNSKVLFNRNPIDRVSKVAPWLTVDGDPYPAVVNGKIVWILDGFTTLDNYPYAEQESLGQATDDSLTGTRKQPDRQIGYIRNSVKATVDAYTGKVTLYSIDDTDPVLKAWESVFPGTVQPSSAIPTDLSAHFRYPEDLFKVQRDLLAQYHVNTPNDFYSTQTFWSVPPDPTVRGDGTNSATSQESSDSAPSQPPYYIYAETPGESKLTFQLTSSMAALQRQNLASWISVSCDPGSYGHFTVLELPTSTQVDGPLQVQNKFNSTTEFTRDRTQFSNSQVDVKFGNLLTIPLAGKFLYVEPVYIQGSDSNDANSFPQFANVLVDYDGKIGYKPTLTGALDQALAGGASTTGGGQDNGDGSSSSSAPPSGSSGSLDQAITGINNAITELQNAYKSGDLAKIGKAQSDLQAATQEYERIKGGTASGKPTSPSSGASGGG